jgi:hypothetical protein
MRISWLAAILGAAAWAIGSVAQCQATNLRRTLVPHAVQQQGGALQAALQPLGSVIGTQVANQIPTLSTSAGYTYEYNPAIEAYERSSSTFGPLFSERAVTVGKNKFNVNLSYTYLHFNSFNGHDINHLTNHSEIASIGNQTAYAGLRRPDLAANFPQLASRCAAAADPQACARSLAFTQVTVDLDLEAQLFDFSFTYGVLDNLDVNIDIPVVRTYARSEVTEQTLDPRFASAFDFGGGSDIVNRFASRNTALGVGDIRLRAKYLAVTAPVRLAGLLDLALPTGSPGNFQGTGDTRLGTFLIASQTVGKIFEPHAQAGVEFNANDVDRSQAKYLAGVTAQIGNIAAFTVDFLGRSEFARMSKIPSGGRLPAVQNGQFTETQEPFHGRPLFIDIKRNDILDLAVGGKVSVAPQAIIFATVILPLNDDGLRADVVPTVGFEATF